MASTNKTTNYQLSQFQSSDIPAWLTDYNGDMQKIDAGIHAAKTQADGAASGVSILQTTVSGKQDRLNFDNTPIAGSINPVTSGGIYNALQNAQIETDAVPTEGSTKAVQSGGVYTALLSKQNKLTFDSTPTQGSMNPVTSGGVFNALGGEVAVIDPNDGTRSYDARAFMTNHMLIFTRPNSSRMYVAKADLTRIESSVSYAYTDPDIAIQGNPLNLPTYMENTVAWRNASSRQAFSSTLVDAQNNVIGSIVLQLRFDGSNTRLVYVVSGDSYTNFNTTNGFMCNSLFCAFISPSNK